MDIINFPFHLLIGLDQWMAWILYLDRSRRFGKFKMGLYPLGRPLIPSFSQLFPCAKPSHRENHQCKSIRGQALGEGGKSLTLSGFLKRPDEGGKKA
jgi:hypothetical protein